MEIGLGGGVRSVLLIGLIHRWRLIIRGHRESSETLGGKYTLLGYLLSVTCVFYLCLLLVSHFSLTQYYIPTTRIQLLEMSPLSKIYTFSLPLLLSFSIYNLSVHSPSIFASLTKDPLSLQHDSDFVGVSFRFLVVGMTLGSLLSNKKGDDGKSKSRSGLKKSSVVYPLEKIEACSSDKDKFVVMFEVRS